ncbi:hypothetical protein DKX38_029779 [Salix brachista]|uniref:Uncharacterized protein n=1 Tax=Salix brachista TaxID=2182728 RepID=A0A5N5J0J0_9ROSI|nr:hypothetical protein DKX38_029779 [Salix brachista]
MSAASCNTGFEHLKMKAIFQQSRNLVEHDPTTEKSLAVVCRGSLPKDYIAPNSAERILFYGWRRDMEDMIMLIDGGLDFSRLENIQLLNREGNAVIRRHLESLPLHSFDSILILADEWVEDSAIQADSRSLATLLLIRDIQSKRLPLVNQVRRGSFSQGSWIREMQQASDKSLIISEILDPRTKNLLCTSKISDHVLSNELVSMALAMVAEDQQIYDVLEELFAEEISSIDCFIPDDTSIYIKSWAGAKGWMEYLRFRVQIRANAERAVINPPAKTERRRWSLKDAFVVIAEKE